MATFTGADKAIGFLFEIARNIADDYDSSSTYAPGAYTIYAGTLYKCIAAVSSAEDFNPAKWDAVLIMDEVAAGGGGGGGTTVIANPPGAATDTLDKLQVGATIYDVPSGGGSSGHTYSTSEKVVGAWVDGSTLYEKTFIFRISDFQNATIDRTTMQGNLFMDVTNPGVIWIDEGASFLKNEYSGLNPKSLILNYPVGTSYTRTNIQATETINSGRPYIYFENRWAPSVFYDARNYLTWYITVKYTKAA